MELLVWGVLRCKSEETNTGIDRYVVNKQHTSLTRYRVLCLILSLSLSLSDERLRTGANLHDDRALLELQTSP